MGRMEGDGMPGGGIAASLNLNVDMCAIRKVASRRIWFQGAPRE